ncbi:MAG: diterpene synthase [Chloroflexi bacterium]|nr:diterpene synthase [Chloroflexota bacterium]MDL1940835.1 diterpene synthase [Chloroflexi bacterium CFX2]
MSKQIALKQFLELPVEEAAEIVRAGNVKVCVFPFNGTRRWFLLEHGHKKHEDISRAYNDLTGKRYIEMYQMLFRHGIETVVAPIFGGDIMERGEEYMNSIGSAMSHLAEHPDFLSFYREFDVRVRFYGDYRKKLHDGAYSFICDKFDKITQETIGHGKHRLFYGVFANDATEAVAEIAVNLHRKSSQIPGRREIVEQYYGEYIEKADIFIGFEKFSVFDYPLLNTGNESLYFTAAPSLFMTESQLRYILYDHLYLRPVSEPDYQSIPRNEFEFMKQYYEKNRQTTYGVGELRGGIWYLKSENS